MRSVVTILSVCGLMCAAAAIDPSVESDYHERIASRATGVHDAGGHVYFHVRLPRDVATAEEILRRKAMLAVQRQLLDWTRRHAPTSPQFSEDVRRMEELAERFGSAPQKEGVGVSVPGRVFVQDDGDRYAYAFVADRDRLLKEAAKGVPGRTEQDIRARWRRVCRSELARGVSAGFWNAVGCGDPLRVPDAVVKAVPVECCFLEGWEPSSEVIRALKTQGQPSVEPEDIWAEGLSLVTDLNRGSLQLQNAGPRFYAALSETPGSPVLWCHLGNYFVKRELYNLAASAYKNALCLSGRMDFGRVLASICENLGVVHQALGDKERAHGYRLLAQGLNTAE